VTTANRRQNSITAHFAYDFRCLVWTVSRTRRERTVSRPRAANWHRPTTPPCRSTEFRGRVSASKPSAAVPALSSYRRPRPSFPRAYRVAHIRFLHATVPRNIRFALVSLLTVGLRMTRLRSSRQSATSRVSHTFV